MELKIEIGGKYRTRGGLEVTINAYDSDDDRYPWGGVNEETGEEWYTRKGRFNLNGIVSDHDLIDIVEPAPFTMDARATMAMHFMAQWSQPTMRKMFPAEAYEACLAADALIAELTNGKTE